jgi:predicted DNA-binding transcriptional regulator AlpA
MHKQSSSLLSIANAATICGISRRSAYRPSACEAVPTRKVGGSGQTGKRPMASL